MSDGKKREEKSLEVTKTNAQESPKVIYTEKQNGKTVKKLTEIKDVQKLLVGKSPSKAKKAPIKAKKA
jgi:hypothetical protein